MKLKKNLLIFLVVLFFYQQPLQANTYFLDFKLILNQSEAGKKAQNLKKSNRKWS